ncbi:glycosyltransferase [Brumimicrobium aurantiacum]|uniref:Glycosyltransferase n=1 Tax=Brumimicrobium aurantiacum TaxID=1737063 RepID=A0A3E1F2F1_9FLAO|nr:glycosyltransferase [Brumimicrobium aurantiacum]RFC55953.1 glycosyltransferase [Brumimicrobium aurantiacum]
MKYWLITTEFPPIHGGGISTYCWHTAKMFSEKKHEVTVFVNDYAVNNVSKEKVEENITLIRFNPNQVKMGSALGHDARLGLEFANIVELEMQKSGVPDILETQDYLGIGYYILQKKALLYPLFKDLKVVLTMHAPSFLYLDFNQVPYYNFPEYWTGEFEKASIRMADLVLSPSQYLIDQLDSRMNLQEKNPIRVFNPYRNNWSTGEIPIYDEGDLVFFGKLTPQKGCLEMLSYLKEMWDNGFSKVLTIIGGGNHFFYPFQEDMIEYVKKRYSTYINKGLITFEGNMPPVKLKERLKKAHVIITPSIVDNLPYAVLESMALGKLILASENGGHTEIIKHGENGFIFKHGLEGSFADTLSDILQLKEKKVQNIGIQAQKAVEFNTNYETIYSEKIELLSELMRNYKQEDTFPFIETVQRSKQNQEFSDNSKLSIVIPYYNLGEFIMDTIHSLKKITVSNVEIIIVNDGSTDAHSIKVLDQIKADKSITIYNKPNQGLSLARNFGAKKSTGTYLAFLDADDTVSPEYYERAIEVLKQYKNVSFIGCWAQYFGESTDIWPTFNPEPPYLLTHNMINSSALVYKREDFLSYGQNDPNMVYGMEDYDSVISMVKNGARGLSFPELWWQYRIRKNSMAQSFTKNKELYLYRKISEKHKGFFQNYGSEIANILNHNGTGIYFDNPTWPLQSNRGPKIFSGRVAQMVKKNPTMRFLAKKIYNKLNK